MTMNSIGDKNVGDIQEPIKKPSGFMGKFAEYKKTIAGTAILGALSLGELPKQDVNHSQETAGITQDVRNKAGELLSEINPFSPREAAAATLDENIDPKAKPPINRTAHLPAVYKLLLGDKVPNAFTFTDKTNVELNTLVTSEPLTIEGISNGSPVTIVGGEYSINGGPWTTAPGTIRNKQTIQVRNTSSNNYATPVDTTLTIEGIKDTFTSTTLDIVPDYTPPTIDNLPLSLEAGVASGSTTASTVNMTDESAWGPGSSVSITADNGGTISGLDTTSYGVKPFNFIAPTNPGPNPLDVTITYSITDAGGNVTTKTQVVPVAVEVVVNQAPVALDGSVNAGGWPSVNFDFSSLVSDDTTPDNQLTFEVVSNPQGLIITGTFPNMTFEAPLYRGGDTTITYRVKDTAGVYSNIGSVNVINISN